jgi:hypothetical protein
MLKKLIKKINMKYKKFLQAFKFCRVLKIFAGLLPGFWTRMPGFCILEMASLGIQSKKNRLFGIGIDNFIIHNFYFFGHKNVLLKNMNFPNYGHKIYQKFEF